MRMSTTHTDRLREIEAAIAEALTRIERQRQMIEEFQSRGYDVRAPLTLLASLLLNLRRLEDRRRAEQAAPKPAQPLQRPAGAIIAQPTSRGVLLCK
jgi:uncharacterized protein (UPF0335 family)